MNMFQIDRQIGVLFLGDRVLETFAALSHTVFSIYGCYLLIINLLLIYSTLMDNSLSPAKLFTLPNDCYY